MGTFKPFFFRVSMWTNVLANIPSFLYKRIGIVVKILFLEFGLIKQQKKIPI